MNEIRDGHYTLGIAYLNAERYAEAITHFQQSVELDATFVDGYHALALAHFGAHRLTDAKAAALEALKIDATHAPTLSFLQALDPGASAPQVSVAPSAPPDVVATQAEKEETAKPTAALVPTTPKNKAAAPPKADAANMNRWVLQKAFRQQYRTYALQISAIVHIIMMIGFSIFFLRPKMQEVEDAIHVELIEALPRQEIVKQKVIEIQTPIEKVEMPIQKKLPVEKQVNVVKPEASLAIAKMPARAPTAVEIQQPSAAEIDVDVPMALSTDADLLTAPDSVVSVRQSTAADVESRYAGRSGQRVKNPRKGAGAGTRKWTKETGAGQEIGDGLAEIGAGEGQGLFETGPEQPTFRSVFKELTEDIIDSSGGAPVDVVFVVDASGSMQDNINAVAEHLSEMVDAYKASEIDYRLGLTHFSVDGKRENRIPVFQLTQDLSKIQTALYEIELGGDEHALDAINETVMKLQFRSAAIKHLILVTDEDLTSLHGFTVDDAINLCRKNRVFVNVLGIHKPRHRYLAAVTGGTWCPIPVNLNIQ